MEPNLPSSLSLPFVEGLYADYLRDPRSVPEDWQRWFEALGNGAERAAPRLGPSFAPPRLFDPGPGAPAARNGADDVAALQDRADQLVRAFRVRGHRAAAIDPLGLPRAPQPELDPSFYGFSERDLARTVSTETLGGRERHTLGELIERLQATYCRSIGAQFMHIDELEVRRWLQQRMESTRNRIELSRAEQLRILTRLTDAVIFEEFIQKKYLGAKSFSLEGCESLIPLLDLAIEKAGEQGVDEVVLAMAHRGRLNVLANLLGKSARQIFREFEDADPALHYGRGDVKYHLGHSGDWTLVDGRQIHLSLCFNPSHLEFVSPVALGRVRAKQDRWEDSERRRGLALLIHGDAAFAGEGIVQETLNLSELAGFRVGGSVHVIVNNQLGFTTRPVEYRSSTYATDVAKMLQSPIFHVNGEDPEAVAQVVRLGLDFRERFQRDVVIDMYGYRRRGHNEGDEPSFTDPLLYATIARRKGVREGYLEHLLELGGISREEADEIAAARRRHLEEELSAARREDYVAPRQGSGKIWLGYVGGGESNVPRVETGVDEDRLAELLERLTVIPEGFHLHPKLQRGFAQRRAMASGERPLDWSAAEALAFATLATEGHRVRLSGQDTARGTFSQRHAVLHDFETDATWIPLANLAEGQAPVELLNSPLSEAGVLGFEYGYSLDYPEALVLWEAQFGDFINAAQVIVDQFIASAEDKWQRLSGIVLLLPHGFEGMGPEHSSARLERFLLLAAEDNLQVVNLTTPAQYFHCLRRQVIRRWRKPLIVMTPKSLLRHPRAVSPLADLAQRGFRRVLHDDPAIDPAGVERVLLCSGKLYYELLEKREEDQRSDVALVRLEQLYPLSEEDLEQALAPYPDAASAFWVQEEPENMGAWRFLRVRYGERLLGRLPFSGITRPASASPATGSAASHKLEQQEILLKAFDLA
ncbi:MAG TPA: 2-oxoglutarate dehydrogenase E1 component [Planctomycetota bacterium]|nr:2-oxoglutarate dehydrogenase E1 component [Planctomycetota bacterium]